jgi:hypothetical protein
LKSRRPDCAATVMCPADAQKVVGTIEKQQTEFQQQL